MGTRRITDRIGLEVRALERALWPPACRLCGRPAADGVACADHRLDVSEVRARCGLCARPLAPGIRGAGRWPAPPWRPAGVGRRRDAWHRCPACRRAAPGLGRLLVLGDYPGALRPWVLALKGGRRPALVEALAGLLAGRMAAAGWTGDRGAPVTLVPVPCHPLRRIERGFDQARLLAEALAPRVGGRALPALVRRRATPRQGEPGSASRRANVAGAFALAGPAPWTRRRLAGGRGARVLLVDDVVGTGATLGACARVLRASGCRAVGAVALGRGRGPRDPPP